MSFTRLPYDVCSYEYELAQTTFPGTYHLATPANTCKPCFSTNPHIRLQSQGVSVSKNSALIDIDSELIGITRNASRCPSRQYLPSDTQIAGNGTLSLTGTTAKCSPNAKVCIDNSEYYSYEDCHDRTEDSRLNNPPSTLRCTGWNRWEWLWKDPQYNVEIPYDYLINSQLLAKDNHRPCLPKIKNQYEVWPTPTNGPILTEQYLNVTRMPTQEPTPMWMDSSRIRNA